MVQFTVIRVSKSLEIQASWATSSGVIPGPEPLLQGVLTRIVIMVQGLISVVLHVQMVDKGQVHLLLHLSDSEMVLLLMLGLIVVLSHTIGGLEIVFFFRGAFFTLGEGEMPETLRRSLVLLQFLCLFLNIGILGSFLDRLLNDLDGSLGVMSH